VIGVVPEPSSAVLAALAAIAAGRVARSRARNRTSSS
jgi:hypothetical protein